MSSSASIDPGLPPAEIAPPPAADFAGGFDAGVLQFAARLRNFVRKRVGDERDAEDVVQDVLLKVFRSRGRLRDARKLEAWIYQTARSTIIDHYRRRRPAEELPGDLAESIAPHDEVADRLRLSIRGFLATLPETYRQPLLLAEFQGKTAAEIARELNLSLTATKSRLARGRALLRQRLLACCAFEADAYGHVIDMERRGGPCSCGCESAAGMNASNAPSSEVELVLARDADMPAIYALLRRENLPTEDLEARPLLQFLAAWSGTSLIGCAAVEPLGSVALLRSVAVVPNWRGRGIGRRLVDGIERLACRLRLAEIYLLTTTAEAVFARLAYATIPRAETPPAVRQTTEFASLCPASAVVMHKRLSKSL